MSFDLANPLDPMAQNVLFDSNSAAPRKKSSLERIPEPKTLADLFRVIEAHKKPDLFKWKEEKEWKPLSSDEFVGRVKRLACHLRSRIDGYGIQKGEHIAFLVYNGPEWHIVRMACSRIGAISIPILTETSDHDLDIILKKARPKIIIVKDKAQETKARRALEELHTDIPILSYGVYTELPQTALTDFYEAPQEDDLAMIFFTSGTTSDPKGVMHTHKSLLSNVNACRRVFPVGPDDVVLSFMTVSHIFQQAVDTLTLLAGATIVYTTPDHLRTTLPEVNPTTMASVPRQFELMLMMLPKRIENELKKSGKIKQLLVPFAMRMGEKNYSSSFFDRVQAMMTNPFLRPVRQRAKKRILPRLRFFISGGAPLEPRVGAFIEGALEIPIYQGWGMTELAGAGTCNTPKFNVLGSCGKPLPGVKVELRRNHLPDDLKEDLPEGAGEIFLKGPIVLQGYWQEQEATAETIQDGWLKTGDIGRFDKKGALWIVGRKKGVIVLESGFKVYEEELAARIRSLCPLIEQIVFFGHKKPHLVALVYPNALVLKDRLRQMNESLSAETVKRAVFEELELKKAQLAPHERIKKDKDIVILEKPLSAEDGTLTPTQKPRHRMILEKYGDLIEAMYT